jgi:uncharacterized protein YdhG (YjbR/CyaY superfamily)
LVYFAAFKNHIGFYPTPSGIKKFKKELSFSISIFPPIFSYLLLAF